MKRRTLSLICLLLVLATLFSACTNNAPSGQTNNETQEPTGEEKIQNTVTVGINRDFNTMDPCASTVGVDSRVWFCVYEGLTEFDKDFNVVPRVAESWEQIDDTTLRFHLRDDVYFHNGDKLTPEDVIYSIKRCQGLASVAGELDAIDVDSCKAVDDLTVDIVTFEPYAPLLRTLTNPYVFLIVSKSWCEQYGDDLSENMMGTGPFKFVSRTVGDNVQLVRNDEYWGEVAKYENLIFRVITEATTRAIEVETEGIDVGQGISINDVLRMQEEDKVDITFINMPSVAEISFNCQRAPFDKVEVRQAIQHAVDMKSIVEALYMGLQEVETSVIASNVEGYYGGLKQYEYDPELAKQMLADAGYPDGFDIVFKVSENADYVSCAEMIKNQLAAIGVNVTISVSDAAATSAALKSFDYDLGIRSWGASSGDPDSGIWPVLHSSRLGVGSSSFADEETDRMLEEARTITDNDERMELYKEIQEHIHELSPWIYFTELKFFDATHRRVVGYEPNSTNHCNFNKMYVIEK